MSELDIELVVGKTNLFSNILGLVAAGLRGDRKGIKAIAEKLSALGYDQLSSNILQCVEADAVDDCGARTLQTRRLPENQKTT